MVVVHMSLARQNLDFLRGEFWPEQSALIVWNESRRTELPKNYDFYKVLISKEFNG